MIAMQYGFTLPGDYDMAIIRRRIAEKGHLLDDFPMLHFKAYLYAERGDARLPSRENLYAPFYLWQHSEGINAFLGGAGFAGLVQAFGRPRVHTWLPWQAELAGDLSLAASATRELHAIPAAAALDELRHAEAGAAQADIADGALAAVSAYDPDRWTLVRFRLWPELRPELAGDNKQLYRVGHVSQPERRADGRNLPQSIPT